MQVLPLSIIYRFSHTLFVLSAYFQMFPLLIQQSLSFILLQGERKRAVPSQLNRQLKPGNSLPPLPLYCRGSSTQQFLIYSSPYSPLTVSATTVHQYSVPKHTKIERKSYNFFPNFNIHEGLRLYMVLETILKDDV
jgi:hypothetical protein